MFDIHETPCSFTEYPKENRKLYRKNFMGQFPLCIYR